MRIVRSVLLGAAVAVLLSEFTRFVDEFTSRQSMKHGKEVLAVSKAAPRIRYDANQSCEISTLTLLAD